MIELQLLNYVIQNKSINLLLHNNITPNKFSPSYQEEAVFVFNHYHQHGKVPDGATMLSKFEDFEIIDVEENENYLVKEFRKELIYRLQIEAANEWSEALVDPDSEVSFNVIKEKIEQIDKIDVGSTVGIDIIKDKSRLERYRQALDNPEVTGIPTGIKLLDDIIHGILPNDLTVVAARTNQGKSFLGMKLGANIWEQGKKILFYSGENSVLNTGYRFDTLKAHFSNSGLMFGNKDLKNSMTPKMYENYVNDLAEKDNAFIVVTPQELNGDRLDINRVKSLYEVYKPDILILDQLSLMSDYRGSDNRSERFKYSHIMEDLRLFVETKQVPVIVMSQTSRNNTKNDDGVLEPAQIEHLSESDGVGQNATKVITFAVNKGILHVMVRKNTNGEKERGFKMVWDIDTGVFEAFTEPDIPDEYDEPEEEPERKTGVF